MIAFAKYVVSYCLGFIYVLLNTIKGFVVYKLLILVFVSDC